jgi:hypothetical protein
MTRARFWVAPVALLLLALSACGHPADQLAGQPTSDLDSQPSATPPALAQPRVMVSRSGGIAGVADTITVEPAGQWTRTGRAGERRSGQLTDDQRARLSDLATDPRLVAESAGSRAPTKCRDAFNYALEVGSIHVNYVDCPADAGRPDVAMSIVDLLTKATG